MKIIISQVRTKYYFQVDIGSLKDTVPADRAVLLRGGWSLIGKRSVGEILLRLTYKAYVEDEEDERSVKVSANTEKSRDKLSDPDELDAVNSEQRAKDYLIDTDTESFIELLSALLVSEEFQGVAGSEKVDKESLNPGVESFPRADSGRSRGILCRIALR